uniref:receptor protein-tyrosine kinase n=1 Tax=Ascaris suum TaxID=6253 RepID=F1KQA4_ASCSU
MTSADSALVTWDAPISMPFQAKGVEWRNLRYECRVMNENDEESAKAELTHLDGTSLAVTVSPGVQYHATVRVCVMSICSPFASAINSAFAPFNDPPFVLFNRTDTGVDFFDPLGLPLDKYEIGSPLPVEPTSPFAIDPTTQWLYAIETDESTIFRIRKDGSKLRFLDTVTVHFLAVLPKYALIIVASDYLILSYRLTSSLDQVIYSCEAANNCGEVAGVAADDQSGDIFFLIQNLNGTTSLFGLNQEVRTPYLIASSTDFPPIRQLVVAKEKLAFITKSGNMGVCDKKLGSLNFNMALARVSLLTAANIAPINALNFTGEIGFVDDSPSNLSWSIDPTLQQGKAIYKISMFKERWGGERFVDISMDQNYVMSATLLEQWPSRQKFDVQIDAITAWNIISANQTGLYAPTKPPLPPNNLRIYATQQKTVDGARALIDLFWDEPTEWNGDQVGYVVNCSVDNTDQRSQRVPPSIRTYSFSVKSGRVSCEVAASNDPAHETFSEPITIDSSELRPLVRLFAVNSSFAVIAVSNWSSTNRIRSKRQNTPPPTIVQQVIAFIGSELYSIRKDSDSAQPFLLHLDMTKIESILHKVSIGGEVSAVDAVISDWLGNRLLFVSSGHLMQIGLDGVQGLTVVTPRRLMDLSPGAGDAKQLLYDPFTNTAYLLTKNGSLFALYLTKGEEENLALRLDCLKSETITSMMSEFAWNRAISPAIYVLTWNGMLRVDITSSKCEEIHFDWAKFGEKGLKSVSSFAIADKLFVFVTSSELIVYELSSSSATPVPVAGAPFKQVLAVSQSSQPYPDRSCFALPESSDIKFTVENEERSGAIVTINEPPLPNSCPGVSVPPTQYEIHFKRQGTDKVRNIRSINHIVHIDDGILDKEADYDVTVSWFNRFSPPSPPSEPQTLRTGYGFPSSPQEPAAFALTPDTVLLYWKLPLKLNAPIPEIKYRISQLSASLTAPATIGAQQFEGARYSASPTDVVSCLNNPCSAKISNLRPSTDYKFWVRAVHESHLNTQFSEDSEAVSMETSTRTKDICGTLRPDNVTGTSLVLRWNSLQPESPPSKISIQYRISGADAVWKSPYNATFEWSDKSIAIVISALRSATSYDYRFVAEYSQSYHYGNRMYPFVETYYQSAQQIKTKPGTPSAPASVLLVHENDQWIVRWQKPLNDGGSPIMSYALEYRPKENAEWEIAERGIEGNSLWWKPPRANFVSDGAEFRIRAANSEGFGAYAYSKQHEGSSDGAETSSSIWTIVVVLLIAIILLIAVIAALFFYYQYAAKKEPKTKSRDIGLQTFKNGTQNGALPTEISNDLKSIPRVEKRFVNLSRMIGKGSFGEVFEGVACGLPQSPTKGVRVAIKTLKSGYSETDRLKFLKEAILMNNFDHPNIVKLMGVSLESEPYYLIIELMEGGDLLGFLRSSRPSDCLPSQLSLCELIDMMVDVGRGGTYLEANRHVHRDLAARNCLISSRNSYARVTKIADFGLARDVYTNDYYRVHGEDFLPLRWLAPESITDGVFTSKSDVWSFGVLLWEILTLGQQPYIGKHNVQVMSFVKGGGRPEKPPYCPDEIFNIVERAWIYDPEKRPGFADLLPELEALRGNPAYQDDSAFPPLCMLVAASNFDLSMDSNISVTESAERSGSMRFDKSDNPSTKKQGRPSILRSLRKERPKPPPSREELESRTTSSRAISLISNETLSTALESDYTMSGKGIDNEGFISSDYYETPTRRINTTRSAERIKSPAASLPPSIITERNSSSTSPPSSSHSQSPQDSPSIFVRPARVSRV